MSDEEEAAKTDYTAMQQRPPSPPMRQPDDDAAAAAVAAEDGDVVEANDETTAEQRPSAVSRVETVEMRRRLQPLTARTWLRVERVVGRIVKQMFGRSIGYSS